MKTYQMKKKEINKLDKKEQSCDIFGLFNTIKNKVIHC